MRLSGVRPAGSHESLLKDSEAVSEATEATELKEAIMDSEADTVLTAWKQLSSRSSFNSEETNSEETGEMEGNSFGASGVNGGVFW